MNPRILIAFTMIAGTLGAAGVAHGLRRLALAEERMASLESTPAAVASPAAPFATSPIDGWHGQPQAARATPDPIVAIDDRLDDVARRIKAGSGLGGAATPSAAPVVLPPRDVLVRIAREEYLAARRAFREAQAGSAKKDSWEERNKDQGEAFVREMLGLGKEQARAVLEFFEESEKRGREKVDAFVKDYDERGLSDIGGLARQLDRQYDEDRSRIRQMLTPDQFVKFTELVDLFGNQESREYPLADGKSLRVKRTDDRHAVEFFTPPPPAPGEGE